MNSRNIILIAFILVALVQLFVPAKMIFDKENVLETGTEYKFRTAPVDPIDPFRGKYIALRFDNITIEVPDEKNWKAGEIVYVSLTADSAGYAKIESVSKDKPAGTQDFVKAHVGFVTDDDFDKLTINYPFDRYYMEESKAYDAELLYRQLRRDSIQTAYALVSVKKGDAVLKEVFVDGIPIGKMVKKNREGK